MIMFDFLLRKKGGGRGGGSRFSAQAYFPQPEGLKEFQAYLKKHFQIPS